MEDQKTTSVKDTSSFLGSLRRVFSTRRKKSSKTKVIETTASDANPYHTNNVVSGFEETVIVNSTESVKPSPVTELPTETPFDKGDKDLYYNINDAREKIAVIFNHSKYDPRVYSETESKTPSPRSGTEKDCKRMKRCLINLGFKEPQICNNFTVAEIDNTIAKVSSKTASEVSCIVVVVMTHGNAKGYLEAKNCIYPKSKLFDPFTKKTTMLGGVPKLFFIQACRGDEMDGGIQMDGAGGEKESKTMPRHADLFMMYSTVENYVSWREECGTWFIQEVCNQLDRVPCKWHILELMTFVCCSVASYKSNTLDEKSNRKKGIPQMESTLTKLLNFSN